MISKNYQWNKNVIIKCFDLFLTVQCTIRAHEPKLIKAVQQARYVIDSVKESSLNL